MNYNYARNLLNFDSNYGISACSYPVVGGGLTDATT